MPQAFQQTSDIDLHFVNWNHQRILIIPYNHQSSLLLQSGELYTKTTEIIQHLSQILFGVSFIIQITINPLNTKTSNPIVRISNFVKFRINVDFYN